MTQSTLPRAVDAPEWFLPAWAFSLLFHIAAILLMGFVIQQSPRGASDVAGASTGIVLNTASAAGELFEGEEDPSGSTFATAESDSDDATSESPPTDILSVLPSESATSTVAEHVPRNSPVGAGNPSPDEGALPGAVRPVAASQPDAGQFTKGGSGRRGSPGNHGYAQVSVFGVKGEGNKFVYLFDRSSSMEGAPLAAAKRQLIESLQSLASVHQFHIIFFNTKTQSSDITGGGRRIAFATDRNKQLAANFVGGVTADGGTDRLTALEHAISFAPDVIFFLTDADDPMGPGELAEIAETNSRAQAAICVIEFGRRQSPPVDNFLMELARQSGGQYGYVNTATLGR